jgi:hypothetical protein
MTTTTKRAADTADMTGTADMAGTADMTGTADMATMTVGRRP